jgi:hypothetical protein
VLGLKSYAFVHGFFSFLSADTELRKPIEGDARQPTPQHSNRLG